MAGQCGAWSRVVLLSGPFQIPQSPLQTTAIRDREEEFCIAAEEENQALLVAEAGGTVVVIVGSGLQGPEATMLLTVEVGPRGLAVRVSSSGNLFLIL